MKVACLDFIDNVEPMHQDLHDAQRIQLLKALGAQMIDRSIWDTISDTQPPKQIVNRRIILPLTTPELARKHAVIPHRLPAPVTRAVLPFRSSYIFHLPSLSKRFMTTPSDPPGRHLIERRSIIVSGGFGGRTRLCVRLNCLGHRGRTGGCGTKSAAHQSRCNDGKG